MEIARTAGKMRWVVPLFGFVVLGLAAFYIMAPFHHTTVVLLVMAAPLLLVFVLPAATRAGWENGTSLLHDFNWQYGLWFLLFLSGLVFRLRNVQDINANLIDAWAVFRMFVEGVVALLLVMRLVDRRTPWLAQLFRGLTGILAAYIFVCLASTLWSVKPAWTIFKSLEYAIDLAVLAAIVISVPSVDEYEGILNWTWTLLGILLATAWAGAVVDPKDALLGAREVGVVGYQLQGLFPNISADSVGEFSAILAAVALSRIVLHRGKESQRGWYWMLLVASLGTLYIAQARSALVGFVFGAIVLLMLARKFLLTAMMGVIGIIVLAFTDTGQYFWQYFLRGQTQSQFQSISSRADWWQFAWQKFMLHPWTGYGAFAGGRFVVMAQLKLPGTPDVHSTWVETLVDTSLWGIIPLAVVILAVWYHLLRSTRRSQFSRGERALAIEVAAVLGVLSVRSFFSTSLISHPALPFLAIVGFAEIMRRRRKFGEAVFARGVT